MNDTESEFPVFSTILKSCRSWRTQVSYKINSAFSFRNRVEVIWYDPGGKKKEQGFLLASDFFYKPIKKPFSANCRIVFFETSGYNSRIYAYENDILYNFSIPALYGKGARYYVNFGADVRKNWSCWLRWAQTIYEDRNQQGSGLDEISGNKRSEIKAQILYKF